MCIIVDEMCILNKYTILIIDKIPDKPYHNFLIDGKKYKPVPVSSAKNSVAIEAKGTFTGKKIQFI